MFRLGRAMGVIIAGLRVGSIDLRALSPEDFDWLVQQMIPMTQVGVVDVAGDGKVKWHALVVDFDDHFAGRYKQLIAWLKFALEVNFGPLQDALASVLRGSAALSDSKPPQASTGSSGDSSSAPV